MITTGELIKKVRCLINETEEDAEISVLTDKKRSFDDIIKELLPQAVALVQQNKGSKGGFVNVKSLTSLTGLIVDNGNGGGSMNLPADFVEMVFCRLTTWKRPCVTLYPACSPQANRQYNEAVRSGNLKPMCIEGVSTSGSRCIEFYPLNTGTKIKEFFYEAVFNVDEGLNRSDSNMVDAVAYFCVSLIYNMFERYDAAKSFMSFALSLCNAASK